MSSNPPSFPDATSPESQDPIALRLHAARLAAMAAGDLHRSSFRQDFTVETKSSAVDLVTSVDRDCDALIRQTLQSVCPHDAFLTEETHSEGAPIDLSAGTWIVDPLDGTTNFAHGFPHFCVSIAFVENHQLQVGVVYDALRNEIFHAARGLGAYLNGQRLQVTATDSLEKALLATGFPYDRQLQPEVSLGYFYQFMKHCHGIRRMGAAALDLAYLAAGRVDGFWEIRLAPWDVAAGILLIEEAGGQVTDFSGGVLNLNQRHIDIVGSNRQFPLHAAMIDVCRSAPRLRLESPAVSQPH
jgi:myo-inositol-1(or 4)-monophosphatase